MEEIAKGSDEMRELNKGAISGGKVGLKILYLCYDKCDDNGNNIEDVNTKREKEKINIKVRIENEEEEEFARKLTMPIIREEVKQYKKQFKN